MAVIGWILVGVLVVILALGLISKLVGHFFDALNQFFRTVTFGIMDLVGRKSKASRLHIPDAGEIKSIRKDADRATLESYNPPIPYQPPAKIEYFVSAIDARRRQIFTNLDRPEIDINEIKYLLIRSNESLLDWLVTLVKEPIRPYPSEPPKRVKPVDPPPDWSQWPFEPLDHDFKLPHYEGWLSFLNYFVDKAHAKDLAKWKKYLSDRTDLEVAMRNRNDIVSSLHARALKINAEAGDQQEKNMRMKWFVMRSMQIIS